jgi:WD40 repeat protein
MSPSRSLLWALLALFCVQVASSAADKDALGDPLPEGAKVRYGTPRFRIASSPIARTPIAVSEDASVIAAVSGSGRQSVTFWDGKTGLLSREVDTKSLQIIGSSNLSLAKNHDIIGVWTFQGFAGIDSKTGNIIIQKMGRNPVNQGGHLSANGNWLVSTTGDQTPGGEARVEVWDVVENKSLATIKPMQNWNVQVTLSQDGKTLATWGQYLDRSGGPRNQKGPNPQLMIQIWDVEKQKEQKTIEVKKGIARAAISPDGKVLAVSSSGTAEIELFDAVSGTPLDQFAGKSGSVAALGFSPDGKLVFALSAEDGTAQFWDVASRRRVYLVESPIQTIAGVVFPTSDKPIAWGVQGQAIVMWEIPSGKCLNHSSDFHTSAITSIAFLKEGQSLLSAGEDTKWIEWDRDRGAVVRGALIQFPERAMNRSLGQMKGPIAVSSDGTYVVGWPGQGAYYQYAPGFVFDRSSGKELLAMEMGGDRINRSSMTRPIFSSDGMRIICPPSVMQNAAEDQRVRIWDIKSASKAAEITLKAGNSTAAFTPDDSRLVTATLVTAMAGAVAPPGAPGGRSADLVINGWEIKTGKKLGEITIPNWGVDPRLGGRSDVNIAAVNNSSAIVASNSKLWGVDFEAGRDGVEFDTFPNNQARPATIAISKDGKLIAAGIPLGGENKYGVRIYDSVNGTKLHTFIGHTGPITALTFSPDGKTLASGSQDTTIITWDLNVLR